MIVTVLLILALVCFLLAAANVSTPFNPIGAGLSLWVLTVLISGGSLLR